jgi:exonuclease III
MRVACWNVGAATGYAADTTARVQRYAPQIALLQEVDRNVGKFASYTPCGTATSWGSAILSEYPSTALELAVPDGLRAWVRIAAARLDVEGVEFIVASVHPHYEAVDPEYQDDPELRGYKLDGARWLWHCDVVFGVLNDMLERSSRFIIGGDWNTARAFQNTSVPDARFSEAFFDRASAANWHEVGLDDSGRERPTYRKRGSGYRLDHLFVDAATYSCLCDVNIDAAVLDEGLSDHAPIVADFDLVS